MSQYNIIAESQEYTVVAEYDHVATPAEAYQSEADLEKEFRKNAITGFCMRF